MRHLLLTIASAISLTLCVAAVVLWVRGRHAEELAQWIRVDVNYSIPFWHRWRLTLSWAGGTLVVDGVKQSLQGPDHLDEIKLFATDPAQIPFQFVSKPLKKPRPPRIGCAGAVPWHGFTLRSQHYAYGSRFTCALPLWFVALVTVVPPHITVMRWLRWARRRSRGGCASCGYDLTGNVSGVCPECGTSTPTQAGSAPAQIDTKLN